jgi:hypothetical protein
VAILAIEKGNNKIDLSDFNAGVYYLKDTQSGKGVKIVKL